ncbi:aminodeoxychorismate synthase [Trichomonascus vanleenenianus]|uniref:4-amino-4-deoxychorismate synthase n=1 Tax=Trichomonascus vanleenenianus TaxID=2268995 RepID=UPI003ECAB198
MPSILLIDSYDSFTFNLSELIERVTHATVVTIHNDTVSSEVFVNEILPHFDAVVVGPGPGSPGNPADAGVLPALWTLPQDKVLPIFGVCLGFQSMVLGFGGEVKRLEVVKHGQPGKIEHNGQSIFAGITEPFLSTRYHSLHGILGADDHEIIPLAYVEDESGRILMAGQHVSKPFYGVQYHPESVCSFHGDTVLGNFWKMAQEWSEANGRVKATDSDALNAIIRSYGIKPLPFAQRQLASNGSEGAVIFESVPVDHVNLKGSQLAVALCDLVKQQGFDFTLLNSGAEPGRWSIIGLLEKDKTKMLTHYLSYQPDKVFIRPYGGDESTEVAETLCEKGVYEFLAQYMLPKLEKFKNATTPPESRFVGGLMGYLSYEMGDIPDKVEQIERKYADVSLVDIERSILIDQKTNQLYVVSIVEDDVAFVKDLAKDITKFVASPIKLEDVPSSSASCFSEPAKFTFPDRETYIDKIEQAKEFLRSGDSYELCLTAQTKIHLPGYLDPWQLYKILLNRNPSPYSCYLDLLDSALVGSSPERFMSWTAGGLCEYRPIKGTVKKVPGMTYEKAHAILNTPKERGENLMIVDLIRHDLNQMVENVRVEKLMTVEEYHTVYQLVSVIQGDLPPRYIGIDLLAHSLPPGSMTGAPKKRSVEILRDLEDHTRRGIYSGVSGFWSVTDEGDWSVIIRSAFSYKNEDNTLWRIGAGGAITILSDSGEEWEEMKTKLESALQAFS